MIFKDGTEEAHPQIKFGLSYISKLLFVSVPSWNHGIYHISTNLFFLLLFSKFYISSRDLFRCILIFSILMILLDREIINLEGILDYLV